MRCGAKGRTGGIQLMSPASSGSRIQVNLVDVEGGSRSRDALHHHQNQAKDQRVCTDNLKLGAEGTTESHKYSALM